MPAIPATQATETGEFYFEASPGKNGRLYLKHQVKKRGESGAGSKAQEIECLP
jgi:hypothetical protein